ncbi:MAG: hypothetical protein GQ477_04440 [Nanohaloarchaea archaeon]|nr:hypothetical protein [Candidatus Nanohaloarchaea archaeon]
MIEYFLKNNILSKTEKGYEFINEYSDLNTHLIEKVDVNGGLNEVFEIIKQKQGIKAKLISESLQRPIDTVDKQIRKLVDKKLIERRGSKKTGGYWIKD